MSNDKNTIPATCPPCGCDDGSVGHNIKDHTNEEVVYVEVPCPRCKPCGECEGDGYYKGPRLGDEPCPTCHGKGRIAEPCGECGECLRGAAERWERGYVKAREDQARAFKKLRAATKRAEVLERTLDGLDRPEAAMAMEIAELRIGRDAITKRAEEAEARADRLYKDRYDLLNAKTTNTGLGAAEWQMRTARAEGQVDSLTAENATLKAEFKRLKGTFGWDAYDKDDE